MESLRWARPILFWKRGDIQFDAKEKVLDRERDSESDVDVKRV